MAETRAYVIAVVYVVAALSPISVLPHATAEGSALCMDPATRERAREIIIDGIEAGLRQHTIHVYDVWLKDPSDQPKRARVGMEIGVNAFNRARNAALSWMPRTCAENP